VIRVGLLGAAGRMGRRVRELVETEFAGQARLAASVSRGDPLASLLETDVVIDFSSPGAMSELARAALASPGGKLPAFVVGSTGWSAEQGRALAGLSGRAAILQSSNFSTGVLALLEILRWASPRLEKLGYEASVVERHHVHKKDAPSGTAISIRRAISPENPERVPVESIRSGEIVGDHEVAFRGPADHLVVGHFAHDRSIFARGAIETALWLSGRRDRPGMVPMETYFQERFR
jgi:4-hydroxy-tetrahydrodipicolinate reductase